jgi:hypothetical protein
MTKTAKATRKPAGKVGAKKATASTAKKATAKKAPATPKVKKVTLADVIMAKINSAKGATKSQVIAHAEAKLGKGNFSENSVTLYFTKLPKLRGFEMEKEKNKAGDVVYRVKPGSLKAD